LAAFRRTAGRTAATTAQKGPNKIKNN